MTNPNAQNPARPTGKRQLRGSSSATPVTTASEEAKRSAARGTDDGDKAGNGVAAFPGEVATELRKVIWPTGSQMLNYTLIVFAFLIVLTALVWTVDWGARWVVEQVFVR
ncbi:preprotein translocase subunit SecE [Corynebacterium sp. UBA2622]|uniref:preprotein translocase subunit SecE n=1 Tax=Corynebacterium sp. UBA2622 TaxID=1946393 RepID=UPI0025C63AE2|nr:preprotein translocase subunit SecE [Corynebacterium sp. UBA2622]